MQALVKNLWWSKMIYFFKAEMCDGILCEEMLQNAYETEAMNQSAVFS
jgi:hypothetical protein